MSVFVMIMVSVPFKLIEKCVIDKTNKLSNFKKVSMCVHCAIKVTSRD